MMGGGASREQKSLKKAIKSNDVKATFELLRCGVDIDEPIDSVWEHTPLILATCYGAEGVLPLILRVSKRKDSCNYEGHTALDKGIIYYSLACQFFQHKPLEIEKRFTILRMLIEGGCKRVKVPDIELWIKENRHDGTFIESMVQLFCLSGSYSFKSIGLATMIRLNVDPDCVRRMLESGAGLRYYIQTCHLQDDFIFDVSYSRHLSDSVAELLIRASSNRDVINHVTSLKSRDSQRGSKEAPALPTHLKALLTELQYSRYETLSGEQARESQRGEHEPGSLMRLCRNRVRVFLIPNVLYGVKHLPLPRKLKQFITLEYL